MDYIYNECVDKQSSLIAPSDIQNAVKPKYDFLNAGKSLNIVYEDENIILIDKPTGLLSHPDEGNYTDTAITRVKRYLYEKGDYSPDEENSFAPALVNRIDRNTSGIIIGAKMLKAFAYSMKNSKTEKCTNYICVW